MKTLFCLVLIVVTNSALAGPVSELPHVAVFGTAVTEAKPDLLRWSVTVSNTGGDLAEVSESHTKHTAAVLRLIAECGVRPDDTQTSGMRFSENREYRNESWVRDGYVATTHVSFTLVKVEEYRSVWLRLAKLPGVSIGNVAWDVSERIALQNKTRTDALKAAKSKADQMAFSLGARILSPLVIEELPDETPWSGNMANNVMQFSARGPEAGGEPIAPGSVSIRVRVRVLFQISTNL